MDNIDADTLNKAMKAIDSSNKQDKNLPSIDITEEEIEVLMKAMENPVEAQKRLASQINLFLDKRIEREARELGYLSEHTRKWVDTYNQVLDKIQKAIYGDKSVVLNLHKISHSQIAMKIRENLVIKKDNKVSKKTEKTEEDDELEEIEENEGK